ncbi:hypothetical protein [Mycoplasma anserisalpingitidis]|uniref:Uncharacterized protein n=1 Tax=Mycoplasma anserisalpingitidis TaxID=519450 RepID=A0A5B8JAS0_9MOLU|nr:hypothetical protein [Mycoplasma anserisalpingitidis]QDY88172.1 hypothetical protein FOY43_00635 [Mycoplasma anserisalpingitidis]
MKKSKIILNTTLGVAFGVAAGTLGLNIGLHTKTIEDSSSKATLKDLKNLLQNSTESFKFLKNDKLNSSIESTIELLDKNVSALDKLQSLNNTRESVLDNLIENFPDSIKPSENQFLQDLLKNQASFITESDLRNEFLKNNQELIDEIIKNANIPNNSEKTKELLNQYKENLNAQLQKQDELFKPYIDYINGILGEGDSRLDESEIDAIYKQYEDLILSKDLNVNSLETLKNQIEEYKNNKAQDSEIQAKKESVKELLQQNKDLANNPDKELIKDIESKLENSSSLEELELFEKLLNNNLVHNSDLQKPVSELKNTLKELISSNPLTIFKDEFNKLNNLTPEMIDSIDDVNELAKLKDKYLDDLVYFEHAENKFNEISNYLDNSSINVDIKKADYDKLKEQLDLSNLFKGVDSGKDLKDKIDSINLDYNKVKNNSLLANKQLDQLLKDLEFFDKYPDTKNTVQISNDLIKEKIANAQNNNSIDSLDLDVYSRMLQEELRQNAKEQLAYLEEKAAKIADSLSGMSDPVSQAILEKINQLNAESAKISSQYSPSSTNNLKEQILKYDFLGNIDELLKLNNQIYAKNADIAKQADTIFPQATRDDELYVNTKKELANINDFVNNIKNDLSVLDSPEKFAELIDSLKEKQKEQEIIEKNLKEKNKLENLLKDFANRNDYVDANPEIKDRVQAELDQINSEVEELKKQLENPSIDNAKAKEIIQEIENKVNKQKEIVNLAISENELEKTLDQINKNYPDDGVDANNSRGEGGLRKHYESIKAKILDPNISDAERDNLIADLVEIRDTAPRIKELEDARDKLENAIDNAKSTEHGRITDSKLSSSESRLKEVNAIIEKMLSSELPTLAQLEDATNSSNKQADLLDLAIKQDKIVLANDKLQSENKNIDDPDYLAIKKSFDKINGFANSESSKNDLNQIYESAAKIENMVPLAKELNNLYDFIQSIKDEPKYDILEKQARDLLQRSLFNQDKSASQILDNINEIKESLKVYEAKKQLNEEIEKLDEIFDDSDENNKESDKAIYAEIKKTAEALKTQNNALFDSPYETENSIKQAIEELIKQREKLLEDKKVAKEEFDLAVQKTEEKVKDYTSNTIPQDKDGHNNYSYDKFEEIQNGFDDRKVKPDATLEEIKQINQNLDKAFKYDQANNAIKDLEDFIANATNINALSNDPVLGKVKEQLDNLVTSLKSELIKPENFSLDSLNKIKEQATNALRLAKEQESPVMEKIKEFQNNPAKQKDYEALVSAINKSLPREPYENEILKQNYDRLVSETNNVLELSDLRDTNIKTLGSKTEPLTGLYKQAKDLLGNADITDQKAYEEFVKELDKLSEENKNSKDKVSVEEIRSKLAELEQRLEPLKKLAAAVKQEANAKELIKSSTNHEITQDFLNKFIPSIDKNIADSKAMYMNPKVSSDLLESKANQLNDPSSYSHVKEINEALELSKKVTTLMNRIKSESTLNPEIEYHEYEQVSGNKQNYDNWTKWFKELLTSFYNQRNEENYDNLTLVLGRAEELFNKQKEVSDKITTRKTDVASYKGYQTDVDYLVKKLWDSTPITYTSEASTDAWKEQLSNRVKTLDAILATEESNHTSRTEIYNLINQFKSEKVENLASENEKLRSALLDRISKIEEKNISSLNGDSLKVGLTTETFEEIRAQLDVLTNIFDKATELSSRVKVARDMIINFSSTQDSKLRAELEKLKSKCDVIDTKYSQYNSVEKVDSKVDILTDLNDLNRILVNIEFVSERSKAESAINSNLELTSEEKQVILNILDGAQSDFENQIRVSTVEQYNDVINDIKARYFNTTISSSATEVLVGEPTQVYQILSNSVTVKKYIIYANNILSYEMLLSNDPNKLIDSEETHQAYAQLKQAVQQASSTIKSGFIDESAKKEKFDLLKEKLELVNQSKKADIQKLLDRADELKSYMETADSYGQTYNVKDTFTQKAKTDVEDARTKFESENITIGELNEVLIAADTEIKNQVLALFNSVKTWVSNELSDVMELSEKFQMSSTRNGADVSSEVYNALTSAINSSKSVDTTDTKNYRDKVNYKELLESDYKDKYKLLHDARNQFISELKLGFNKYLNLNNNTDTSKKGLFVIFDEALKGYINNDNKDNLLENAKFDKTIDTYKNSFATTLTELTSEITEMTKADLTDPTKLSEYGTKLTNFRNSFNTLLNQMYQDGINYISPTFRGNIDEIISEVSINTNDSSFDEIKNSYKTEVDNLNGVLTSVKQRIDSNSVDIDLYVNSFIDIFSKIDNLYKWVNVESNEVKLFNYIIKDDKFNNIQTNNQTRRADFINALMSFVPADATSMEFIDITTSKTLLNFFDKFAFTDIDLDTILNKDNVRVRIVKQDDKSWYVKLPSANSSKQILGLRVEYLYTPNNLKNFVNKDEVKLVKDLQISFDTTNIAQIQSGSSAVFVQSVVKNGKTVDVFGPEAKVELIDLERSGLLDNNDTEDVILNNIYESFKSTVLGTEQKVIIKASDRERNTSTPMSENIKNGVFDFSLNNQSFFVVDKYISISSKNNDAYVVLFSDDSTKTINLMTITPATANNAARQESSFGKKRGYRWYKEKYGKVLNAKNSAAILEETMPFAIVNLAKFKLSIDTVNSEKKAMIYLDYYESSLFAKHYKLNDTKYTNTSKTTDRIVWSANDFVDYLSNNLNLIYNEDKKILESSYDYVAKKERDWTTEPKFTDKVVILDIDETIDAGQNDKDFNYRNGFLYIKDGAKNWTNRMQQAFVYNTGIINFYFKLRK